MKASRIILVVVVIFLVAIVALYAVGALTTPASNSAWHQAATYPLQIAGTFAVAGQECVNPSAYVYCVGGLDANGGPRDNIYVSSAISSTATNVTGWTALPSFPQNVNGQACVTYGGYLYCIGGSYDAAGDDLAASYYAPLGTGGALGGWKNTTSYPVPIDTQYCVASSGYVYCVAGDNETDGSNNDATPTNQAFYAPLSSSGIGQWGNTTDYPTNIIFPSCFSGDGYIYCVGGTDQNGNPLASSYYAQLTPSGIGPWTSTTPYPVAASGQACAIAAGTIYCVGGETTSGTNTNAVYYAPISSTGIGNWKQASAYPNGVMTTCFISTGSLYCVGGADNSQVGENGEVYYASLASLTG